MQPSQVFIPKNECLLNDLQNMERLSKVYENIPNLDPDDWTLKLPPDIKYQETTSVEELLGLQRLPKDLQQIILSYLTTDRQCEIVTEDGIEVWKIREQVKLKLNKNTSPIIYGSFPVAFAGFEAWKGSTAIPITPETEWVITTVGKVNKINK
jgi:hypothetical protein